VDVVLGELPSQEQIAQDQQEVLRSASGITVDNLTPGVARQLNVPLASAESSLPTLTRDVAERQDYGEGYSPGGQPEPVRVLRNSSGNRSSAASRFCCLSPGRNTMYVVVANQ